jgi:hypothetical protein
MQRTLVTVITIGALLLVGSLASADQPVHAAVASSTPWVAHPVFQVASPAYSKPGLQEFADGSSVQVLLADTTRGIDTREALPDKGDGQFTLTPPDGEPLTSGVFHLVGNQSSPTPVPVLQVDGEYLSGELDIADLVADPTNGEITHFDAVMEGVGEFRFGEDSVGSTRLGAKSILFAETFVGKPKKVVRETVYNGGSKAVVLGKPTITGQAASSFSVSSDTCGPSLAPGTACAFGVGFAPKAGGPSTATLSLRVGDGTQAVSLAGAAFLGSTSLTSKGDDPIDHGVTTSVTGASSDMTVRRSGGGWIFDSESLVDGHDLVQAYIEGPGGKAPPTGDRRTYISGQGTGNTIVVTVDSTGCDTQGTWNVKRFDLDPATDLPVAVDLTFAQKCFSSSGTQTGALQWQARSDTTAPSPVSDLTISSSTSRRATWKASPSTDAKTIIARLVEGNGVGATPVSGRPLAVSGGTSSALPSVAPGQQYAVVVFAIDGTGNVSKAARATVGTPARIVSAPGAPTITRLVAGDGQITVFFTPPTNDGGLPITRYVVTDGVLAHDSQGSSSPITVSGLQNGSPEQFVVYAYNAAGRGHASLSRGGVTPHR